MTVFPDQAARDYDDNIVKLVPGYALALELLACKIAARVPDHGRVLIVGCGTGAEILAIARQRPNTHFTAVDPSAGMLDAAQRKVSAAGLADHVTFHCGALSVLPAQAHDAATLSLVLHFVADDGSKQQMLNDIAARLVDRACLAIIDPVDCEAHSAALRAWLLLQGHNSDAVDAVLARMTNSWHRASPARLAALLTGAQLNCAETFFSAFGYLGLMADKPSRS